MMTSATSFAGNFDYIRGESGAEQELVKLLDNGNFRQALMTWDTSTRGTMLATSQTGVATWAYALYQEGLPFTALQTLMQSTEPGKIEPGILKLWVVELKKSPFIQRGWIQTTGGWKSIVNNQPVSLKIKTKRDITKAFDLANAFGDNVNEKARVWWQIAVQAPQINDVDSSLRALKLLKESGQIAIGQDEILMTQGRVLYQKKDLEAALEAYEAIPKSSSLWMEAVEERAWTHLRRDDFDKALGTVTTAMAGALAPLAGPETFFLANLMAYKACDYTRVFNNSETFKKRHHQRLGDLQELAKTGTNHEIGDVFARFDKDGVSKESAGPLVSSMPRNMFRDKEIVRDMESRRQLLLEVKRGGEVLEGSRSIGGNALLERALSSEQAQTERLKQQAFIRTRVLANADLKEYRMVLNKMNIIEGEIIQRLSMDDNMKGERSKLPKVEEKGDVLVFPVTDETWMDELDNYKARVKDCPTMKKASL